MFNNNENNTLYILYSGADETVRKIKDRIRDFIKNDLHLKSFDYQDRNEAIDPSENERKHRDRRMSTLRGAIANSEAIVLHLDKNYLESIYCLDELDILGQKGNVDDKFYIKKLICIVHDSEILNKIYEKNDTIGIGSLMRDINDTITKYENDPSEFDGYRKNIRNFFEALKDIRYKAVECFTEREEYIEKIFNDIKVITKDLQLHMKNLEMKAEEQRRAYRNINELLPEIHSAVINLGQKPGNRDTRENIQFSDRDIRNSAEMLALKKLLKNMPIEQLKIKAYKYLPISYFSSLPNTIDGIIDRLLEIGMIKEDCVPIVSLFEGHSHKIIMDFIRYLKRVKYAHIENFICDENPEVETLSLLINISQQDGSNKFKIETWRYANGETHRVFDGEILEIDLDDHKEITKFLDKVYDYLEEARTIYKSTIYIDLILPTERAYRNLKFWENSEGISIIRKYNCIHRLQSRFLQPDNNWRNKWEALEENIINVADHTKFIEGFSYNGELSNANYKVILKEKVENENYLFLDIREFGIPILLSSLSSVCNIKEIKDFGQEEVCTHIMDNHDNEKSDIFFMLDNPNKIPNEFKNPEQNLYDW